MRRFNYDDNEEFRDDVDKFFGDEDDDLDEMEKYQDLVEEQFALEEAQIEIEYSKLNQRILQTAVSICEKSFWWSFFSLHTRTKMITDTYKKLKKLEV
jgi:hypothetical protein